EDGVLVETQGLGSVTAAHHAGLSAGDKVTVAIRPESFQLSRKTNADQDNLATALFTDVAFKGNRFAVNLRTDNGEAVHVQISNQEFPELAFESQSRTSLSWSKSSTMLFRQ
ncbi:TOBE domain-containing protein, partial [Escherichia coli]|nr:TOBE domain-containing protein [Escherichia coli]